MTANCFVLIQHIVNTFLCQANLILKLSTYCLDELYSMSLLYHWIFRLFPLFKTMLGFLFLFLFLFVFADTGD
jgi:hypothetical protein